LACLDGGTGRRTPERRGEAEMTARSILLVDDDEDLRETLVEQLSLYEEFAILQESSATKGVQTARGNHIDLLIMDVGLPDMDGREAVKLLRKGGFKAPIIMLTGHDTDSDTILGLEAGANDYVTKPFRFAVLLARIRAQLRQHEQSEDATFSVGPYTFKPSQKLLLDDKGGKIRLTEKESAIIRYLYRAEQKVVTRDVLLEEVWGYNSGVTTHTLETHVYRLRQKIEADPSNAEILVTDGGGYKIVP
jgi:DNA-binding response OmpR family regulator